MKSRLTAIAALGAALATCTVPAHAFNLLAGVYGPKGNDTGGIIPWSPENERDSFAIASEQCARWNKYPVATSIHRQYGDYIGYKCVWNPPVAVVGHHHHRRRVDVTIDK